jgi:hypothetical protein
VASQDPGALRHIRLCNFDSPTVEVFHDVFEQLYKCEEIEDPSDDEDLPDLEDAPPKQDAKSISKQGTDRINTCITQIQNDTSNKDNAQVTDMVKQI